MGVNNLLNFKLCKEKLNEARKHDKDEDMVMKNEGKMYRPSMKRNKERIEADMCEVEHFLDKKHHYNLIDAMTGIDNKHMLFILMKRIKKIGFTKAVENLNEKCRTFATDIHKKMASQNSKHKLGIYYSYDLMFIKNGRGKCPDNIIIRITRVTKGKRDALIWVGLVGGQYNIYYSLKHD